MYAAWPANRGLNMLLVHPDVVAVVVRVGVLAELPVRSPAAVGSVRDVDEPLGLALMVAVVVGADQIAVLVEREFLRVAQAGREDLEVRAVRLGAHDRALVRVGPFLAGLIGDGETDVPHFPVEAAVRPHGEAGDPVPAKRRVDAVALADDDLAIDGAVLVVVLETPDAWRRSDQEVAAVVVEAAGDVVGRIGVEALDHDLRRVGQPVAVRILNAIQPLPELDEVAKIV